MKYAKQLIVLIGFFCVFSVHAGSFEDFFVAVKRNEAEAVSQLIARGFDANAVNEAGDSAVLIAVREPSPAVLAVLLRIKRINVDLRNAKDETALMLAALRGDAAVVGQLLALDADVNKPGWAALHYAATSGHTDIMKTLLARHAYIDAESPNKSTPLMMAAMYGSPEAVKLLLDEGADAGLKNEQGLSALDFAAQAKRPDAERMLKAVQPRTQQLAPGRW